MVLGEVFEAFVKESPISVMVCGTLERIFHPAVLNQIFQDHAILNYTKELTFAHWCRSCRRRCSDNRPRWELITGVLQNGNQQGFVH